MPEKNIKSENLIKKNFEGICQIFADYKKAVIFAPAFTKKFI